MERRRFQTEARQQLNASLNNSRHPIYLAPCGTGKTYTAAALIKDRIYLRRRVFVLVPQVEIFDEWMRVLVSEGLDPGYVNDEGVRGRDRGVYVCMTLSLINLLPVLPESIYPDEIITDEMQHSLAYSWEAIYRFFPRALRIGLTATLYHGSLRSFAHLYTDVIQTISKPEAIEQGYITKPLLVIPELYAQDVPRNGDDFDVEAQAKILGRPQIVGNVIDFYSRTFEGKPVIVPCATHEHAKLMVEAFNGRGWQFQHVHSLLAKGARKSILRAVATGRINGICTVGIGIEGMSIPGLYGVLWLRRTASPIIWCQFNGRAERIAPGKTHYICADFVGNSVLHGMPDRHMTWTVEQANAEIGPADPDRPVMVMCGVCGVMNSGLNVVCHFCGSDLLVYGNEPGSSAKLPAMVDGELVVLDSDAQGFDAATTARIDAIKAAQAEARAPEPLREIPDAEKVGILRRGLFEGNGRKLFSETVKDWM